jgi:hypothetical protein
VIHLKAARVAVRQAVVDRLPAEVAGRLVLGDDAPEPVADGGVTVLRHQPTDTNTEIQSVITWTMVLTVGPLATLRRGATGPTVHAVRHH